MTEVKPNAQTFYWYDYETFGLNPRRDRPAQFAGMRTTLELNPVEGSEGEGEILYCRPSADQLPSPESCLLTGITPQLCEEKGLCESAFAGEVFERLNTPGTISIGYNTLGFDDEVNRFLFWRNFLDAYTHSWKDGCSRWDLFPLVCATWALRGDAIKWPKWEEIDPKEYPKAAGRRGVCFKLEFLSKANGITHSHAHDALSDVEATIGLARLIATKEPRLWKWALVNRTTQKVHAAIADMKPVVWVTPRFGVAQGCTGIVAALYQEDKNTFWMWDLMEDPEILRKLSLKELHQRVHPTKEDLKAGIKRLPLRKLKANASPFVCADLRVLSKDRAERYGIDFSVIKENYEKLCALAAFVQGALKEVLRYEGEEPPTDIDTALYSTGFSSLDDRTRFSQIRSASPEALREISEKIAQKDIKFDNAQFEPLLLRFRARNWPESLTREEAQYWRSFCRRRLIEGADGALTLSDYFEQIDTLQEAELLKSEKTGDECRLAVLEALYAWGEKLGDALEDDDL